MAPSTEILNTTFAQRIDRDIDASFRRTELLDRLYKGARVETMTGGTYIERPFTYGSPGTATALPQGDEVIPVTRAPISRLLRLETNRIGGAVMIPGKDLKMNAGKEQILNLYKRYPLAYLASVNRDLESWFLTGALPTSGGTLALADVQGFTTLNGSVTGGTLTGAANGVLDFAAPASQTDSVFDLAKDDNYGWYNQYGASSGWSTDGLRTLRNVYRQCVSNDPSGNGPDLLYPDVDTFSNYEQDQIARIRLSMVEDKMDKTTVLALSIGKRAELVYSDFIDRTLSAFTAGAPGPDDGLVYFLNTDMWEMQWRDKPSLGSFEYSIPNQDVVVARFLMDGGLICTHLRSQGVAVGTAV